jgi:hypothetical protein
MLICLVNSLLGEEGFGVKSRRRARAALLLDRHVRLKNQAKSHILINQGKFNFGPIRSHDAGRGWASGGSAWDIAGIQITVRG